MNSAVDLKETDLEWIGSIPEHWDLKNLDDEIQKLSLEMTNE